MGSTLRSRLISICAVVLTVLLPCAVAGQEFDDEHPENAGEAPVPVEQPGVEPDAPDEAAPGEVPAGDIPVERPYVNPSPGAAPPPQAGPPAAVPAPVQAEAGKPGKNTLKKKKGEPQDAVIKVSLKVIYASKEQKSVDKRIADLAKGFQKEFKEYELSKFQLLESKEFKLEPRVTLPIDLPGGKRLNLTNGGIKDKKVVLHLDVPDLIKTTVLVASAGKFSFGGPKYKYGEGMIILVIKARPAGK